MGERHGKWNLDLDVSVDVVGLLSLVLCVSHTALPNFTF